MCSMRLYMTDAKRLCVREGVMPCSMRSKSPLLPPLAHAHERHELLPHAHELLPPLAHAHERANSETEIDGHALTAMSTLSSSSNVSMSSSVKQSRASTSGCSISGAAAEEEQATSALLAQAKRLVLGVRGARVAVKGTRQSLLGAREAFHVTLVR